MPKEPVPVEPFLRWVDQRLVSIRVQLGLPSDGSRHGDRPPGSPLAALCAQLGWDHSNGARYINRLRNEVKDGLTDRARIEDALHHAGVGWWEVYGDEPVPDQRWCGRCDEPVAVVGIQCCWCGSFTRKLAPEREALAA